MRTILALLLLISFSSCWERVRPSYPPAYNKRVWGNKPVYDVLASAKLITYHNSAEPVVNPGNIYALGNRIFQLELGKGIHVIDNSIPSQASRIGFITVNGSSEISIKGSYLYTNSFDDLVVIDISAGNSVREVKRISGAFPEGRYNYFMAQPEESGYYECPAYDSVVIGWRKDSIMANCYKN